MKKLFTLIAILAINFTLFSQAPQRLSYQAVIRNSSGGLVVSHAVGMKISILQGTSTGTAVYIETHTTTTNANGLATIEIGGGSVVSGTFAGINWGSGTYFIKTETDPEGGSTYTIKGTSQILSVPYALYSNSAANGFTLPYSGSGTTSGGTDLFYLKNLGTGRGMQVEAGTNTAIWGRSAGGYAGIDGRNTTGYGVYGISESGNGINGRSTSGNGVYGEATKYGVYGKSTGTQGRSVTGEATGTTSIAVQGIATNTSSTGVWGEGSNQGVYGTTALVTGKGVYGVASSTIGTNYGVYGESASGAGYGVYGEGRTGIRGKGVSAGVYGEATGSSNAIGVEGRATSTTGTGSTYGVYGSSATASGYSGFFTGGKFHVSGSVAIGTTEPGCKFQVGVANDGTFARANAWNVFSDVRLKKDFTDLTDPLDMLGQINGFYFYWNTGTDNKRQIGFSAQEIIKVLPEVVLKGEDGYLSVDYGKITPLLLEAIKELKTENEIMRARLEKIEKLINLGSE